MQIYLAILLSATLRALSIRSSRLTSRHTDADFCASFLQAFTVKLVSTMNVALYGAMVAFLQLYMKGERRVAIAGGIGASFALAVFVAPLTIIVSATLGALFNSES